MKKITKDELREIPFLHKQMVKDVEKLQELEAKATEMKSSVNGIGDVRVQHSIVNTAGIYVEAAADLRAELEERDAELNEMKARAQEWIDSLPAGKTTERKAKLVLKYRYVRCYSWEKISEITGYTIRRLHQIETENVSALAA